MIILYIFGILLIILLIVFALRIIKIGTAYKAKILCSAIFISNRKIEDIIKNDLNYPPVFKLFNYKIDYDKRTVECSFFGLFKKKAIFRDRIGCSIVIGNTSVNIKYEIPKYELKKTDNLDFINLSDSLDKDLLLKTIDNSFIEKVSHKPKNTKAVVILYKGQILSEKYADRITCNTPLAGWSMTKSIFNALTGILVKKGILSLNMDSLLPEWSKPGDPRKRITLDNLLRMRSGLRFDETYVNLFSDVMSILYITGDAARYAYTKKLKYNPGDKWYYSSGTTNIISQIIKNKVSNYYDFPYDELFNKIGMYSAILETDYSGTFIGSSYCYVTARDWAKFGLFYLQDGVWKNERLLPEGWVKYSITPAKNSDNKNYGAHFWLGIPSYYKDRNNVNIKLPEDIFHAIGFEGQFITIIPSKELVIVRLGNSFHLNSWDHQGFVFDIVKCFN